jgi:hypothetical protein
VDNRRIRKKSTPVYRYIVPAILIFILIAILAVFVITVLSMAGLTPGS